MAAVRLGSPEGTGGYVLLAGDAGVGKTRLQAELRERAAATGWRVLVGHCLDFGDSSSPYLPFTEVFVRLAAESPGLAASLVESFPALARLLPAAEQPDSGQGVEPVNRAELFESVHAALDRLGRAAPLLLLIEDIHWADRSTRDLLSFFFTRPFSGPVSVVVSYRSDDLHRRHPLRAAVAEWSRLPAVSRLHLAPLSDDDVRALVGVLLPEPISAPSVRGIVERAEGNAFFAEELVAAAGSSGVTSSLPDSLTELLLVRLDQLDSEARSVVRAAAVAGRRVAHSLLAAVVDRDGAVLDRGLRSAVESNVLVAVQPDGYAFRHALLAEAVYDDLLPGERVRLHAAYARALSADGGRGSAADLARHARAADDRVTALHASVRAGDEAMALAGPDEAARHYEVALELLARVDGSAGDDPVDAVDLSIKASEAAAAAGHLHRAVALVQDQLSQLSPDTPPLQKAQLLLALARVGLITDSGIDVLRATTDALPLVPAEPPTPLRARLLSLHARANAAHRRDDQAVRWSEEALQIGQQLGLPDVLADVTTTMAHIEQRRGDPESSRTLLVRNIEEARLAGEPTEELRGLFALAIQHFEFGRIQEALSVFRRAADRAVELGRPWAPYGFDARAMAGVVAYVSGDWDYVLDVVNVSGESPPALAEATLAGVGLSVAAGRGHEQALETLSGLRGAWHLDGMIAILCGSAAIDLHGDRGDIGAATAAYNDVVVTVSQIWRQEYFQARMRLSGLLLGQLCGRAVRSAAQERPGLAALGDELVAASSAAADEARGSRTLGPEATAWLGRVSAEHARLRWLTGVEIPDEDGLVKTWRTSVELFDAFGHVFEAARSRARLASVLRAVGRFDEAAASVAAAREVAQRLGAEPLLAELRVLGRAGPERRSATSRRDAVLTPREHEVLVLVAQGRSNAEIARHLFISAKTVSVHVSNILAKLGAGGRTEAAALARREGILP